MAKLKAPLLSFEARGQIAKALVYFPWKGIPVVREYVVPANPNTTPQQGQRAYITAVVALIHTAQAQGANSLDTVDQVAYSIYSRTLSKIMTWFNAAVKQFVDQKVASLFGTIYRNGAVEVAPDQLTLTLNWNKDALSANDITAGTVHYGTSPTALTSQLAAVIVAGTITRTITGLTTGVKYYIQFRATAHADFVGTRSGIYHGTPT